MTHELPELPYELNALEPYLSRETLEFHYGKHHKTYVDNLNKLVAGSPWADATLEDIIAKADGGVFNNAAQIWNHTFYWHCLTPESAEPQGDLLKALSKTFGSLDSFKEKFSQSAATNFGAGWTWLVKNNNHLEIVNSSNADTPLRQGIQPLLTIDVWEHAYYIDYRNARPKYIENFWHMVNWDFVAQNLQG